MQTENIFKLVISPHNCRIRWDHWFGVHDTIHCRLVRRDRQTSLNPPAWVFGPVWTTLFALMGIAAFLIWKKGLGSQGCKIALGIFLGQLVLNTLWSIIFLVCILPAVRLLRSCSSGSPFSPRSLLFQNIQTKRVAPCAVYPLGQLCWIFELLNLAIKFSRFRTGCLHTGSQTLSGWAHMSAAPDPSANSPRVERK